MSHTRDLRGNHAERGVKRPGRGGEAAFRIGAGVSEVLDGAHSIRFSYDLRTAPESVIGYAVDSIQHFRKIHIACRHFASHRKDFVRG